MSFTISDTLRALMNRSGTNSHQLSRHTHIRQPIIHRLLSGENINPTLATLKPIGKYFGVNISQLIGEEPLGELGVRPTTNSANHGESVPLFSAKDVQEPDFFSNTPTKWLTVDERLGKTAFAIQVAYRTMEPAIPEGATVVIEPMLAPIHKDFVLVKQGNEYVLKYYIIQKSLPFVLSVFGDLNSLEMLSPTDQIIGTMIKVIYNRYMKT